MLRQTPPAMVATIDALPDAHSDGATAGRLNLHGLTSGEGLRSSRAMVTRIRLSYAPPSRYERLHARGLLTLVATEPYSVQRLLKGIGERSQTPRTAPSRVPQAWTRGLARRLVGSPWHSPGPGTCSMTSRTGVPS
jgi:hypothetical protein